MTLWLLDSTSVSGYGINKSRKDWRRVCTTLLALSGPGITESAAEYGSKSFSSRSSRHSTFYAIFVDCPPEYDQYLTLPKDQSG